ncbi:MAG: hypothetical protein JO306_12265, partial [Gemmatimonadetes bacterium]|nr:hypothetical protein [Gemmatimonadota bacterium]
LNAPPALVSGGYTWAVISPGYRHTCGVTTQQLAYCWGANYSSQLGTGDQVPSSVPRKVAGQP